MVIIMNAETLQKERIQNLIDATALRGPKKYRRAEILTWPFSYAGVRYADVMDDAVKTAQAYVKFLEDIELDFLWGGMVSRLSKRSKRWAATATTWDRRHDDHT
jgi:hypothetical protein